MKNPQWYMNKSLVYRIKSWKIQKLFLFVEEINFTENKIMISPTMSEESAWRKETLLAPLTLLGLNVITRTWYLDRPMTMRHFYKCRS